MSKKVLVIQGPNINMLGDRETGIYGKESFDDVNRQVVEYGMKLGFDCDIYHSNIEGEIINKIHQAKNEYDAVIINAGAYTHYSYAIRDAIAAIKTPTIEVHLSNIHGREEFRHKSVIAPVCIGQVAGFGKHSYFMAMHGMVQFV